MKRFLLMFLFAAVAGFGGARLRAAQVFVAHLSGAHDVPANTSHASGFATVHLNRARMRITVRVTFRGLEGPATAAHIHGPAAAGANAGPLFPLSGVPNTRSGVIQTQTFTITRRELGYLESGMLYVNVHSTAFPDGEIRGQLEARH
jgi:hypothetical protein